MACCHVLRRGGLRQVGYSTIHKLVMPNITPDVTRRGLAVRQQNAQTNLANRQAAELIRLCRKEGLTYRSIADRLNQMGSNCLTRPANSSTLWAICSTSVGGDCLAAWLMASVRWKFS